MPDMTLAELEAVTLREDDASALCGMSGNNLREHARLGHVSAPVDARFPLVALVSSMLSYYKGRQSSKAGIERERERTERLKGDIYELDRDARRGKLIPIKAVQEAWEEALMSFRGKLMSIPARWSSQLAIAKTTDEVSRLLTREINEALHELSGVTYKSVADEPTDISGILPIPGGLKEAIEDEEGPAKESGGVTHGLGESSPPA